MEAPFVSEEFQRAFRNTFKGQTSTGRDLHVSDVVIPVVDFTPTASGTSLPINLVQARSYNTNVDRISTATTVTLSTSVGFNIINATQSCQQGNTRCIIQLDDGSTQYTVFDQTMVSDSTYNTGHNIQYEEFVVFQPVGYTLTCTT